MHRKGTLVCAVVLSTLACAGLSSDHAIDDDDRAVLLQAHQLVAELGLDRTVDPTKEFWTKSRSIDGAWEVAYRYDDEGFSLLHTIHVVAEDTSATTESSSMGLAMSMMDAADDTFELVKVPGALSWGDARGCKHSVSQGTPTGLMCIARKDHRAMMLWLTVDGVDYSPDLASDLLGERLTLLEAYTPKAAGEPH